MTIVAGYAVYQCPQCPARVYLMHYASFYIADESDPAVEEFRRLMGPLDLNCSRCGHEFASRTARKLCEVTGEAFKAEQRALAEHRREPPTVR